VPGAPAPVADRPGHCRPDPDLVGRDFTAEKPGEKMVGDITYIFTWEGWIYLATVIDCATRMVVGWATDDNYKTPLITSAIKMAARNVELPDGRYSTATAEAITPRPSSPPSLGRSGSGSRSGERVSAMTIRSRSLSTGSSKSSEFTATA